ncbi:MULTISPECIES: ABC transporter ATP-binding protein [Rhizobium]|uniref:ABC transporter ATP-binding protein n=2 Tax=Rhizobium TaxID=379 RepID=A0A387G951_9HYPH|nr:MULTISPECIES: ABC transporter ATP-binding protein [Rhizobium]AYG63946.1 ABC transporter ATP-binding protein [Rhizobium jaguaris]MDL2403464.1 ABC transporter ATP-binding protein [Rhizobium mayense]
MTLLSVNAITRRYTSPGFCFGRKRPIVAVENVSLSLQQGTILGLVGESGSGKSTTGKLVLGLEKPDSGEVIFAGNPLPAARDSSWRSLRAQMQMVYQDPLAAMDPRMTISSIISEPLHIHGIGNSDERDERVSVLLRSVGLGGDIGKRYPHELSGGQRQRVVLARALASGPRLLVCDEPVSALDVSIQAQILNLLADLRDEFHLTILFISHDMRAVRSICDELAVMYLGNIVEIGQTDDIVHAPAHPYTRALMSAVPALGRIITEMDLIDGEVDSGSTETEGCKFYRRCPHATYRCRQERPRLAAVVPGRQVACHFVEENGGVP